jgi:hypothetical protein
MPPIAMEANKTDDYQMKSGYKRPNNANTMKYIYQVHVVKVIPKKTDTRRHSY